MGSMSIILYIYLNKPRQSPVLLAKRKSINMKRLLLLVVFAVCVYAENVENNSRVKQQENAPYRPTGWRPSGQEFRLPEKQVDPRMSAVPKQKYGPPEEPTTTEYPTTTDFSNEAVNDRSKNSENLQESDQGNVGVYYIYHPSGLLQRVEYNTRSDEENKEYVAQLKYKDVEPIKDPIYTYDPNTLTLQQIQVKN